MMRDRIDEQKKRTTSLRNHILNLYEIMKERHKKMIKKDKVENRKCQIVVGL